MGGVLPPVATHHQEADGDEGHDEHHQRRLPAHERAERAGPQSREAVEAIYLTRSLWSILVEDLANPENQLPEDLRASLISIGLWIMREAEAIRLGRQTSFAALIEITLIVVGGSLGSNGLSARPLRLLSCRSASASSSASI